MTKAPGDKMTGNKTFVSAVIGWALVVVLTASGGAYLYANAADNTSNATVVNTLTEKVDTLTAENKAISDRLNTCLGDTTRYKTYTDENHAMFQQVSDKWGVNYMVPLKDVLEGFNNANAMLDCR